MYQCNLTLGKALTGMISQEKKTGNIDGGQLIKESLGTLNPLNLS